MPARRGERGAAAVEYGILISSIALVVVLAVAFLGSASRESLECAGKGFSGTVCTQTCTSQNGDNGKGCYGK